MQTNNRDDIPIRVSQGEQIASNAALELIGRDLIPMANKAALNRRQPMQPNSLPRLGKQFDQGNRLMGNTQIPGVNRKGNSFSQARGFQPTQMPAPLPNPLAMQPIGIGYSATPTSAYSAPIGLPGYATGTQEEEGVQYPEINTLPPAPYQQVAMPANNQPIGGQTLPHLPGKEAATTQFNDGQGGTGSIQFQDGRTLPNESFEPLLNTIAHNALPETRAKYQANADAYEKEQQQQAQQAQFNGLLNTAQTSPNASTQGIGDFITTSKNQKAALQSLPTLANFQHGNAQLAETVRNNQANTQAGIAEAAYKAEQDQNKFQLEQNKSLPNIQKAFMIEALQKSLAAGKGETPEHQSLLALYQQLFGKPQQQDELAALLNQQPQ